MGVPLGPAGGGTGEGKGVWEGGGYRASMGKGSMNPKAPTPLTPVYTPQPPPTVPPWGYNIHRVQGDVPRPGGRGGGLGVREWVWGGYGGQGHGTGCITPGYPVPPIGPVPPPQPPHSMDNLYILIIDMESPESPVGGVGGGGGGYAGRDQGP